MIWPFHVSQRWLCVGYIYIPLNVACYLVYNEVTDEQIITIFYLVLQVHCSPSLKEYLHNPVMPHLARSIERKESILCAHGGVCACVGVVVVCEYIQHLCQCIQNGAYKSTCKCISNHTSAIEQFWQLLIVW